ncbi:hypothetical protein Poly30_03240 [Planctomycetes bacterium Poly30]|uniref:Uncharacterized protein n=1 Tax=Saltatorellus ferox TaxID=2528018 RepID=A0A518EL65_9BACT|nr:hypothetical protein Poly30_03240 [Planctomycetes bacterium Poly30]
MKNSSPLSIAPLPAAPIGVLLALAAWPSLAFSSPSPQAVVAEVVALPQDVPGVTAFTEIATDQAGSWVAATNNGSNAEFYGVLAGSGTSTPSALRTPQTLGGRIQENIFNPRVRGVDIAYTAYVDALGPGFTSWVNDTPLAVPGDAIGTTLLEWGGSSTPRMTAGPRTFVKGFARPLGNPQGPSTQLVVRYPAETIVIASGDTVAGLSGPVSQIRTFESSPDGTFWVAVVAFESSLTGNEEMAIVGPGGVHRTRVGLLPVTTEDSSFTSFTSFQDAFTNDRNDVTFLGRDDYGPVLYRDGAPVRRGPFTQLVDTTADGFALTDDLFGNGLGVLLDGVSLDRIGADGVDASGNGFPDAGFALAGPPPGFRQSAFLEDGRVLAITSLQVPGGGVQNSLVIASLALPNDVVCEGVPNSLGVPSSLRAIGLDKASFNDLELRLINHVGGLTIPLVSSMSGFVANPGGSVGNLCLGGSIGRGLAFTPDLNTTIRIYPQALPQPGGFVAAQAGQTWYFQAWHRDFQAGAVVSNFSSALAVTFR